MFAELDAKNALLEMEKLKGKDRAALLERIFRLETAHFKSSQYKLTGSSGMEYGKWYNLNEDSFTIIELPDNHIEGAHKMRKFIKWNSILDFCIYLSDYIDRWKENYARWNTTDLKKQAKYAQAVKGIKNKWIV